VLFSIVFEKKGQKKKRNGKSQDWKHCGGLICSGASSRDADASDYARKNFTLSDSVSAAMSVTLSFPPVQKRTHDTNAIRVAWDTRGYHSLEQKCINSIYLRRHIGDRLP